MARRSTSLTCLLAAGLAGGALVAAPTSAAPTWKPITNLFADLSAVGGSALSPDVVVDADGDATAIWSRYNGSQFVVQASTRPAGGTWSAPVDLAAGRSIISPQLAVDAAGNTTAVWRNNEPAGSVVQAATRPADGPWSAPVDLSTDTTRNLSDLPELPQVDVAADGTATAVWSHDPGSHTYVVQAATRAPGGTWSAPADLSAPGASARTPQIAVAPSGAATVVWTKALMSTPASGVIQSASRPAGGSWSSPADLSPSGSYASGPQVATDAAGAATAVWTRLSGSYVTEAATRPAGGDWSASTALSAPGQDTFTTPQVATGPNGRTIVLWQRYDSGWVVAASTRTTDGWARPVDLSEAGQDAWTPQLAIDPAGNATAVWSRVDGSNRIVQAARGTVAGGWTEAIDLSEAGQDAWNPQVAVDPAGNATTVWSRTNGANWIVQARGLDAAGPVVTSITSRDTKAGRNYSVTAHDVWSRVASARWRFADGSTATGTSVTHDATRTGPVRVVLTDRVGNATTCRYDGTYTCRTATKVAPAITRAIIRHRAIRAVGADGPAPRTTKVTVVLTVPAKVTLALDRKGPGTVFRVTKRLDSGRSTIAVRARIAPNKVLRPGRYTVTVKAENSAGASPKEKLRLRVVD